VSGGGGSALGLFLIGVALSCLYALAAGWALMLAVGVIRAEWLPACPTIGYWPAVAVAVLLRLALHTVSAGGER
jgi:hypothetical protein